jgi:hypothetical protein
MVFLLVLVVLFLSGCSSLKFDDYEQYATALSEHSDAETERITEQAQSIVEAAQKAQPETALEQTLLSVIAMQNISQLEPVPLGLEKPTTGMDVLKSTVSNIPFMTSTLGMYKLGEAGINAAGNIAIGDNVDLDNSLNDIETHATGQNNTATSSNTPDQNNSTTKE